MTRLIIYSEGLDAIHIIGFQNYKKAEEALEKMKPSIMKRASWYGRNNKRHIAWRINGHLERSLTVCSTCEMILHTWPMRLKPVIQFLEKTLIWLTPEENEKVFNEAHGR